MIRHSHYEHRFVKNIPRDLEPGILYVSVDYGTVIHSCFCGCGEEVVTPLAPKEWRLTFDGETISIWPSIGNWNLACQSHYILKKGQVVEAECWNEKYLKDQDPVSRDKIAPGFSAGNNEGLWFRIRKWLSRLQKQAQVKRPERL